MPIVTEWGTGDVDVAVIGAGAAGIAAARRIMAGSTLSVLVLEAGSRLGGRAFTLRPDQLDAPLDLGCGWLHGARTNAWTRIGTDLGFDIDRNPAPWDQGEGMLQLGPQDQAEYDRASEGFYERVAGVQDPEHDRAMGDLLGPHDRWRPLLDAISTYVSGTELARVSCRDHEAYRPGAGPDWRVADGYGSLVAAYGAEAPVMLNTPATAIDHQGPGRLRVDTPRGCLTARTVVVTVSTEVLARGLIRFTPALPDKRADAEALPLGLANKLFLRLDPAAGLDPETYRLGSPWRAATGAYHIRPFGRPVIEAFYGGQLARDLERGGEAAFMEVASAELAALFGNRIRAHLSPIRSTAWAAEPFIGGSYSYATPGAADRRARLAAPLEDRLFFAGEACSPHKSTTAHGAYESGVTAADALIAALGGH